MSELAVGVGYLGRGFGLWRRRPGLMLLGMLPALLVFVVLLVAYVVLVTQVVDLVRWVTPFADDWPGVLRDLLRVLLVLAVLVGALLVASALFVTLTLIVGDPFYERIWRETEAMLGGPVPASEQGVLSAVGDGVRLGVLGLVTAVGVFLVGFVPVVGTVVGLVLGVATSGYLLARELLGRPLAARGLDRAAQLALLRPHRRRVLGFGAATQLCFVVPLGAIVVMPAAVAGSTMLARDLLTTPSRRTCAPTRR